MDISENILAEENKIMELMGTINDPEIPVISIVDLGIIRSVQIESVFPEVEGKVTITPTYSGCPAMDVIRTEIKMALLEKGYKKVEIISSLSPAWTTDWMSEEGKKKLQAYGIESVASEKISFVFSSQLFFNTSKSAPIPASRQSVS